MPTYRIFMLGNDDHIVGADIMDCPTDGDAMTRAPSFGGSHTAVEVWELARCIERVDLHHPADAE